MAQESEETLTIKSVTNGTRLTFSEVCGERFSASLEGPQFSGKLVSSTYHVGPPSMFFDQMAHEWRGWMGTKEWATLERDLHLQATFHPTGQVDLQIFMRRNAFGSADWCLEGTLELEAGQLEGLATSIRRLFGKTSR